ncbi:Uncharacterised protein [Mycobacteroides abscessus subsp. abscessus]|nr:Uncharacterised protein [Mycobacteroides abscessus subsp. abscessus]
MVRIARMWSVTFRSSMASADRRRAATPKSCRDFVTYLARYPATRRGDVRLMAMCVSDSVGTAWFWVPSGWVSICLPNRTTSGAVS